VIRLWEMSTGRKRGRFEGHQGAALALVFAPDGKRLVSGGEDTTVLVWDVTGLATGGEVPPKDTEALWDDLAGEDAAGAHRAVWRLAGRAEAVAFLEKRLRPAADVDPRRLARLIASLDASGFTEREEASRELEVLGDLAGPLLRKALEGKPSDEVRRRAGDLLEKLGGPVTGAEALRALRGVEVLEHAGTPQAERLLKELAGGADGALLTREARAALGRLAQRRERDR
jgi:hypothetical protein